MFTGTLAANAPLTKQKKFPKVRRRESTKENNTDDSNAFTYAQLESFEDDDLYCDTDTELDWIDDTTLVAAQPQNKEATGSEYIKRLLQEEKETQLEKGSVEQKNKGGNGARKKGRQEEETMKIQVKLDDSNLRHLLKEKDTLEVDFQRSRMRSRSNGDLSSSFLSSVLKESLFAAQFTVPKVEGTEQFGNGGALRDGSCIQDKPKQRRKSVPTKLSTGGSSSKPSSRKNSRDKMSPTQKNKDNLVKGLQKSIFQPQLLVQNKNDLATSCPNLDQASQRARSPPSTILAHALKPDRLADTIGSRNSKENIATVAPKDISERDMTWQRVEIINRERKLSAPQFPILSDLVQDALRNSWFAINLPSVILTPDKTTTEASPASSINVSPPSAGISPWPDNEMESSSTNNALEEELAEALDLNAKDVQPNLPTVIIDTPPVENYYSNEGEVTFQNNDFSFEDDFNPGTADGNDFANFSSQSIDDDKANTVSDVTAESQSFTLSSGSKRWKCADAQKKSIMDVLDILRSIQGDSEYGFFEDRCCASGPGLTEGFVDEPATFHLVLMDKPDLLNLFVIIEGPGILQPRTEFTPLTKNIIRVVYWPERVGRYSIRILWKNHEIPGSPFKPIILLPKCEVWIKRIL